MKFPNNIQLLTVPAEDEAPKIQTFLEIYETCPRISMRVTSSAITALNYLNLKVVLTAQFAISIFT